MTTAPLLRSLLVGESTTISLFVDASGNLLGVSTYGGNGGYGQVFEDSLTALGYANSPIAVANFSYAGGAEPSGGLIADAAGNLYGTTNAGGSAGFGTLYEIARTGAGYANTTTTLASFNGSDGAGPIGSLVTDAQGDLLGVTMHGGAGGWGTVFELTRTATGFASTPTVLASFNDATGGGAPMGGLVADAAGNIYGTTSQGGASGDGTVFELAANGTGQAVNLLASFNGANGNDPQSTLVMDAAGDLFGTADKGGAFGDGDVFEIVRTSTGYASAPLVLLSFDGTDGADPAGGVIIDAAGNLFGTTEYGGGTTNQGTAYEIARTASGYAASPTELAIFNGSNGSYAAAGLVADTSGKLDGSTLLNGGVLGGGTIFQITGAGYQEEALAAPSALALNRGQSTLIAGLSLTAATPVAAGTFTVAISDKHGILTDSLATGGSGTTNLAIAGSRSQVNTALAALAISEAAIGADTLTIAIKDSYGNALTQTLAVATTEPPPVLSNAGTTSGWTVFTPATTLDKAMSISDPSSKTLASATIAISNGFAAGDVLNVTAQKGITSSYDAQTGVLLLTGTASLATYQAALDSVTFMSTSLVPSTAPRTIAWKVSDGVISSAPVTTTVDVADVNGQSFMLTQAADTAVATNTAGTDLFVATSGALSNGDIVEGGGGINVLGLSGGGTFDMTLPATLSGVQVVQAYEGQGATQQNVWLRQGGNLTVNVVSDTAGDPSPTITIITSSNDRDTINLGSGNDVVEISSPTETVNSGGGYNTFYITSQAIGATINGGTSGANTLNIINSGGTAPLTMGANISGISMVDLLQPTTLVANSIANMQIFGSAAGGDVITLGATSQAVTAFSADETVNVTSAQAGALIYLSGANSTLDISGTGAATLNANSVVSNVMLLSSGALLTLNAQPDFIATAAKIGSEIKAMGPEQTLSSLQGSDTLVGASAAQGGGTDFLVTQAGLEGDAITGFLSSDRIDVTDLLPGSFTLAAATFGSLTLVALCAASNPGKVLDNFAMPGSWSQAGFELAADGHGGSIITHS